MYRDFAGQSELKCCASPGVGGGPQSAAMRLDNGPADWQSHADALSLGGKECIKDLVRLLGGQPHARIAYGEQQPTILGLLRLDCKFASPTHVLHGFNASAHEGHEDLLQLHPICQYLTKISDHLRADRNPLS